MNETTSQRPRWALVLAGVALVFGVGTIGVGGLTLFDPRERAAAGNIVPFVLWFNFVAGFAYVAAGIGLLLWRRWAAWLAAAIAIATLIVFAALGIHILSGGAFEARTLVAMTARSAIWIAIAVAAGRGFGGVRRA